LPWHFGTNAAENLQSNWRRARYLNVAADIIVNAASYQPLHR
jgi:hypothetical protein